MKTTSRRIVPLALLGLGALLAPALADARAAATRGPVPGAPADSGYVAGQVVDSGLAQSNAAGATEVFLPGYRVTTRAQADDGTGAMRGSAAYALDSSLAPGPPGAFFDDFLWGQAVITGPGSSVQVTLTLDVHGSFSRQSGPSQLMLGALLYAGSGSVEQYNFLSQLEFHLPAGATAVQTYAAGTQGGTVTTPPSQPYAPATPVVTGTAPGNLAGQARITFELPVGSLLYVEASFQGVAGPVVQGGAAQASAAMVDGWNTAQLGLQLPAGYTLEQASGVLAAPITSAVPELPAAWLMLGGLALVAARQRRRGGRLGLGFGLGLAALAALAGCAEMQQAADQATGGRSVGEAIAAGVKDGLEGRTAQPVGYVTLGNGNYVTYFDNQLFGFPSRGAPLAAMPQRPPATPAVVLVAVGRFEGQLMPNNREDMKKAGLMLPMPGSAAVAGGPAGAPDPQRKVPVFSYKDPQTGETVSNAPDACRVINVYDADGKLLRQRNLSRREDYVIAAKCENAAYDAISRNVTPGPPAKAR